MLSYFRLARRAPGQVGDGRLADQNTSSSPPATQRLSEGDLVQLRLGHLNMIQGIIGRMASYSATVKNFCLTITAGLIALSFDKDAPLLMWFVGGVIVMFSLLDAYYLSLEKMFRTLSAEVAARGLALAGDLEIKNGSLEPRIFACALSSLSIVGFYLPLLVGVCGLMYIGPP